MAHIFIREYCVVVKSEVPFIGDYQQDGYSNLYYALVKGRRPLWKKAIKTLSPSFYHYTIFICIFKQNDGQQLKNH